MIMDESFAFSTILAILENPKIIQDELVKLVPVSKNTLRNLLTKLQYSKLIIEESGDRNKRHYSLTDTGHKVAEHLRAIKDLLGEI